MVADVTKNDYLRLAGVGSACLIVCFLINYLYFPVALTFPDEQRFLGSAADLVQSGEFRVGADRAWEMPGAAIFFAGAIYLFGADAAILPIRTAQSLLLVLQSALIAMIARRVFASWRVATIAAAITAFYPFLLYYQGLLLSETLFNTFFIAGMASLYWWRDRSSGARPRLDIALVLACAFFAAATLTKATLTILPPFLLACAALDRPSSWRRAIPVLLIASALYGLFLSPWWIRNYGIFHTFVPFATGSGANLYLGNNPSNARAGIDWGADVEPEVVRRINAIPDELARQREFVAAAVDYIARDPISFVQRLWLKLVRLWSIVPNAVEFNRGIYRTISALSFGPILALALIGAVRSRQRLAALAPIYLFIAYMTAVHVVTIASLRYRLPVEPFLILLAAEPLARIGDGLRAIARWLLRHPARLPDSANPS